MSLPRLVVADSHDKIIDVPELAATGARGHQIDPLSVEDLIPLPSGSELFVLPDRRPVGFDEDAGSFKELETVPGRSGEPARAVAAFASPGWTLSYTTAYREGPSVQPLPLFAYGAVCWYRDQFHVAAVRVDRDRRQDLRLMDPQAIQDGADHMRTVYPDNRLIQQVTRCALEYGCPAARNFFLQRREAPLPTSPVCNAECLGCISLPPRDNIPATQPRLTVAPNAAEIAEAALHHLTNVRQPIVSFGQGCEGEPLMHGDVLVQAVHTIRASTSRGTINLNTNGSRPEMVSVLADAGLNAMRVSLNSAQSRFYEAYYQPKHYRFNDVVESIRVAKRKGVHVSINYLTLPGLTDTPAELTALTELVATTGLDMIQWRNLNIDPLWYVRLLNLSSADTAGAMGLRALLRRVHEQLPHVRCGYFNPAREHYVTSS